MQLFKIVLRIVVHLEVVGVVPQSLMPTDSAVVQKVESWVFFSFIHYSIKILFGNTELLKKNLDILNNYYLLNSSYINCFINIIFKS